jgi:diguanylate cyclase (GGDEF)-like protein/PAS domain S-box-containing protein
MIDCNILRVTALARSVCGISSLFVLSILPAVTLAQGTESSITMSFVWVEVLSALILLFSGIAIWIIARNQTKKIRELKREAEKLRDADYGEPLRVQPGELGELAAVFNDMRDKLKATTISRDYVDSILASMNDAIVVTANDGTIKRVNKATAHLLGYEEQELVGTTIDLIVNTHKSGSLVDKQPSGVPREAFFESKFGESIPVSYTCSFLGGKEAESGDRIYAAQNITERRRAEKRIRYLARIDALTKIPNRMQFQHLLQRCIARARRSAKPLCLFYIDIDAFKEINDTFGHLAGDTTLETVAERLSAALPDDTIIGRLAGDEFAVILDGFGPDESGRKQTDALAMQLVGRLADPFFVQGHEVFMTASMGIAYYPKDAPNVIDLIRNADAALYHAKKSGGNVYSYYEPAMNEAAVERLMTKSKLKRSFERDELLVHYQPKYNLETGEVFGAEALVRWELPERGMILPSDFIPIAEETNLIIEIGEWVLDKVCEDFRFWQRSVSSPGRVSVNLSLKQLRQPNFTRRIRSIMRSYEVSPTSLELEITETTLMENPERTIKLLDQLYALGLHLAIDDFGTGYSSLSALQQFPISTLKIDQSFVRHVSTNPDDATIVSTIIQMGRSSDSYLELLLAQAEGTDTHKALFA